MGTKDVAVFGGSVIAIAALTYVANKIGKTSSSRAEVEEEEPPMTEPATRYSDEWHDWNERYGERSRMWEQKFDASGRPRPTPRMEETPRAADGYKVVHNARFGGFWLSKDLLSCLRKKGVDQGIVETGFIDRYGQSIDRHDPALVSCVEKLGDRANSPPISKLETGTVKGPYFIRSYDGSESIVEPSDLEWVDPSRYRQM